MDNNESHPENRTTRKAFQIEKEVLDIKPVIEVPRVINSLSIIRSSLDFRHLRLKISNTSSKILRERARKNLPLKLHKAGVGKLPESKTEQSRLGKN